MNLRSIKKDIEYVLGAFIDDCTLVSTVNLNVEDDALDGIVDEAVALYNDLKDRVNAKGMKKADFVQVRKDLLEQTDALYEKLSKAVKDSVEPKEEKPAAKKAPAKKAPAKKAEDAGEEKKPARKPAAKKTAKKAEEAE